jgi:hypothetical protein
MTVTNTTLQRVKSARINPSNEEEIMTKWIVVTEVESDIDPAVWSYVNGTTLISSEVKQEDSNV